MGINLTFPKFCIYRCIPGYGAFLEARRKVDDCIQLDEIANPYNGTNTVGTFSSISTSR